MTLFWHDTLHFIFIERYLFLLSLFSICFVFPESVLQLFPSCESYTNLKNIKTREAAVGRFIGDACQDQSRLKGEVGEEGSGE